MLVHKMGAPDPPLPAQPAQSASYPLPDPGMAVLLAARSEVEETRQKAALAATEAERAQSRADAFLSALCAAVGVPPGSDVSIDAQARCLVVTQRP